jgi:hypothetical protein
VWLTPELKPFFGGTYYPPEERQGRPGFPEVLEWIARAWQSDRPRVLASADSVLRQIEEALRPKPGRLDAEVLQSAFFTFRRGFDPAHGGFGGAPKFPRPVVLTFLLRYWERTGNAEALEMVLATLKAMARGGIRDRLGGGFHRYAVDERWHVPHFEKMLYDQAQLAVAYVDAFEITGEESYAGVARHTLDYVLREMTGPEGGFYSAEDADSALDPARPEHKREGAFYLWTRNEIEALLGQPASEWFCFRCGVDAFGNAGAELPGRNVLFEAHTLEETATRFGRPVEEVREALATAAETLRTARQSRPRPHRDDKVLTAWNGLMIWALARAARVLQEPRYLAAARRAADFLRARRLTEQAGGLALSRCSGIPGFLDDYAFFVQGLLDLHDADPDSRHLELALRLTERQHELFEDPDSGGFFSTAPAPDLILRLKDDHDGAEPSGNSIAVLNLLRLARLTGRDDFRASADRALDAFASRCASFPDSLPLLLSAKIGTVSIFPFSGTAAPHGAAASQG